MTGPAELQFPIPQGVRTSVTLHELALLQRFAHEAGTVLEIGTHYGFTCIGMALAGAHVTSVDPHFEGPFDAPDTWEPFLANLKRHGIHRMYGQVPGAVAAYRMAIEDAPADRGPLHVPVYVLVPEGSVRTSTPEQDGSWPASFGLVFIDGNHVWPCPWRDAEIAMAHLTEGGHIAFHDVTPNWPGVYRAALQLEAKGWKERGRAGTLRVYQQPTKEDP